jgi:bacterioferritin-associated ferredoxin
MFVCVCRAVSLTAVERVIREGASSVEEVTARSGAGSCCGACRPMLRRILTDSEGTKVCDDCPRRAAGAFV